MSKPSKLPRKFFARIKTFSISCPNCGNVYTTGRKRDRGPKDRFGFNPRTQEFSCARCNKHWTLGIIAWKGTHRGLPPDATPTLTEAAALRRLMTSEVAEGRRRMLDPVNDLREESPLDGIWRGLPEGVTLEDFLEGRWKPGEGS